MAFMTVIKCHMMVSKYGNMGIKLTVLISLLQINTKYSVFSEGEIKRTKLVILQIFPFVLPFIQWGLFEGPFRLAIQQKNYIFKNGIITGAKCDTCGVDQKWELWNTLLTHRQSRHVQISLYLHLAKIQAHSLCTWLFDWCDQPQCIAPCRMSSRSDCSIHHQNCRNG